MDRLKPGNNFIYLTLSLLGTLLVAGMLRTLPSDETRYFLDLLILVNFLVALFSLRFATYWPHFVRTLTVVLVATVALNAIFGWEETDYVALFLMLVLFAGITVSAFRQVLFEGAVDLNKVVGSVALYILIGLIWTVIYLFMLEIDPGALNGIEALPWQENFSRVAYFSFVTLTTLGYGDITPANPLVEVFVYFEAICGVFYLAIFVAGLVSSMKQQVERS